jgi:uncharacterized protein (TIGR03067 family)
MDKSLPARPNLDHLRRQAKALLLALESGDDSAASLFLEHLPAASGMSAEQIRSAGFRLADAQLAIARKSGFASWPQLTRHVDQLRGLEGTWGLVHLEVDGATMPANMASLSKLLIDGDRFRFESPQAAYEGIFNIDVEAEPHKIDIEFVEGPEAGNWNFGIFRIAGDRLEFCLDVNGKPAPTAFRSASNSGHAYEILQRASSSRPEAVHGGTPQEKIAPPSGDAADFNYAPSATLDRLQGEWAAEKLVFNGQEMPAAACRTGRRALTNNELKIHFGGQLMIHALVRIHETVPTRIDYYSLAAATHGQLQRGILEWNGPVACFCMAPPGADYPSDLSCPAGSGQTLTHWRPKK